MACEVCYDDKRVIYPICQATGKSLCLQCLGKAIMPNGAPCECQTGTIPCTSCKGTLFITCQACKPAKSKCFITTATLKSTKGVDDGYELTTFRSFRDGWLKQNYPHLIDEYYLIAPQIVDNIDALK